MSTTPRTDREVYTITPANLAANTGFQVVNPALAREMEKALQMVANAFAYAPGRGPAWYEAVREAVRPRGADGRDMHFPEAGEALPDASADTTKGHLLQIEYLERRLADAESLATSRLDWEKKFHAHTEAVRAWTQELAPYLGLDGEGPLKPEDFIKAARDIREGWEARGAPFAQESAYATLLARAERMRQHVLRKVTGRLCEPNGHYKGEWGCGMCGGVGKGPRDGTYDPSTIQHEADCMLVPLPATGSAP